MNTIPEELASLEAWKAASPARRRELILGLEQLDQDLYRGWSPPVGRRRVFGGQVAAQAMLAAGDTVEDGRLLHSLHSYFLRPGKASKPIIFLVDRIRDGRTFSTRRVVAKQNGRAILNLECSFQRPESGLEYAEAIPAGISGPLESRRSSRTDGLVDLSDAERSGEQQSHQWFRARGSENESEAIRRALVVYGADHGPIRSLRMSHGSLGSDENMMVATLDHLVWLHATPAPEEWLLHTSTAIVTAGGRGLARGTIHTESGRLIASVVQEALLRPLTRMRV